MNNFAKTNMIREARMIRHDWFNPSYSAFPNTYNPCSPDDFISDEMSGYQSINYLEFDGFKNDSGCKDIKSTRGGRWSHYRGRWSGRGRPNGANYNYPEHGGYASNHRYHKFPDQQSKGGTRADLKEPDSQESTSKQDPIVVVKSDEPGPEGAVPEISSSGKDLEAPLSDFQSRKKEKKKLRKLRRKEKRAAIKTQAGQAEQLHLTTVTLKDGVKTEQLEPELKKKKRKERQSADDEPKSKIAKTSEALKDSTDKTKTRKTDSNPKTTGQISVLPLKKEFAEPKVKLQKKPIPFSGTGPNTAVQNSYGAASSARACKSTTDGGSCTEQRLKAKTDQESRNQGKKQYYEKRISAHRLTFVCQICKFSTFYQWKLKAHLKSKFHRDHFKFLSQHFSKSTVDFLKTHFSKMQQKVQDFIDKIPDHRATLCQVYEDQDLTLGIKMEHFIKKAEAAHCLACNEYIPMQYNLIQLHLRSPDHRVNCRGMMAHSKNLGLSTVQRLLRLKCTRQKLECYLKDTGVTKQPKSNSKEVWSTQQRALPEADMMTQEAELPCEQALQANKAEEDGKDQEAGPFSGQVIQADEEEKDEIDLKPKLICGKVIQATAAVKDEKTQSQEPACVWKIQADGAGKEKKDVKPCIEQVILGNDMVKEEKVESFCGLMMEADEVVGDNKDQEVEPLCRQSIQADEMVRKRKDREEKPVYRRTVQFDKAADYGKAQQTEPLSKELVFAPEPVMNGESQACEETVPGTENVQEPEQWQQTQPLFDLLDEEDDLEGVELGEEEIGEDF